jgi:large subunit ribosomal protein L19
MSILSDVQKLVTVKAVPKIKAGHTVSVHQKIKEGEKERVQIFEGLVIKVNSGTAADKTFTVRKIVDGIGVEKIFPLYSPLIEKIVVKKEAKVRRAKLYYMRERSGKSARLKEGFVTNQEMEDSIAQLADEKGEEEAQVEGETPKAEAPAEKAEDKVEEKAAEPEVKEEAKEEPKEEPKEEVKAEEKVEEKAE